MKEFEIKAFSIVPPASVRSKAANEKEILRTTWRK
jgi:hypothetical protein